MSTLNLFLENRHTFHVIVYLLKYIDVHRCLTRNPEVKMVCVWRSQQLVVFENRFRETLDNLIRTSGNHIYFNISNTVTQCIAVLNKYSINLIYKYQKYTNQRCQRSRDPSVRTLDCRWLSVWEGSRGTLHLHSHVSDTPGHPGLTSPTQRLMWFRTMLMMLSEIIYCWF